MPGWLVALNPGWLLLVTGLLVMVLPSRQIRQLILMAAPLAGIALLSMAPHQSDLMMVQIFNYSVSAYRVDPLNFVFGLGFLIAALLVAVYSLHTDNARREGLVLAYSGAAVSAVLAGDLAALFFFSQLAAFGSVFLVMQAGTRGAYMAGMRYLVIQLVAMIILLYGLSYVGRYSGDLTLKAFTSFSDKGAPYVFLAFAIQAAFPFLNNWLQDALPKASVTGTVLMAAFTTKIAVYAFARLYPGFDILIWIGALMAVVPVFLALIENDLRRVLAFSLNNQAGIMLCAIGLGVAGTGNALALNGVAAHAFVHTIFMLLLFMGIGAVLYRTGTAKVTELGGLYRSMPWTALFCLIGGASVAALPLFSGFISQSMMLSALVSEAAAQPGLIATWLMILFAMAGVAAHAGVKVPFAAFFGKDRGHRVKEAPFNMLLAMGMAALLSVTLGLPALLPGFGYSWLYGLLPHTIEAAAFRPYTAGHVLPHLQIYIFALFAFILMRRTGVYPQEKPGLLLDTDWLYRRAGKGLVSWAGTVLGKTGPALDGVFAGLLQRGYDRLEATFSPQGNLARGGLSGGATIWTAVILAAVLLLSFLNA
ncbi:proton-conducting transporter membrane subunit [Hyphomonas sp.]|uniref:proton-conducting transporter transmembrane domain-containing protein n=1 Tax=Hyphomonas sp. TaxID=87 RepID=UPI00391B82F1